MPPFLFANELEQYQGITFRVDSDSGNDALTGANWTNLAMKTPNAAIARTVAGRGDRVYIAGGVTEPIILDKAGVALVFMPGHNINPGSGETAILVTSGCLIYAPYINSGRIGIHTDGVNNVTVKRAIVSGMAPNGGDAICFLLDSGANNLNNAFVECIAVGDGDEYGYVLNDEGFFHHLDYCVAAGCLSGVKCLAGASGVAHRINRFGFASNTTQIEQVDDAHAWILKECCFDNNPDTTGDGFGDIIPFPASGYKWPDYYPIADIAGWMATMMINKDDLSKKAGTKGTDNIYDIVDVLPSAGSGSISVDHNTGGSDNMRVLRSGVPLDNVEIWAYLKTDYDAGSRSVTYRKGWAKTGVDGRWRNPMFLDAETYTFTFFIQGESQTATKEAVVS